MTRARIRLGRAGGGGGLRVVVAGIEGHILCYISGRLCFSRDGFVPFFAEKRMPTIQGFCREEASWP